MSLDNDFFKGLFYMYECFAGIYVCVCLVPKSKGWQLLGHQEYKWYIDKYRQAKYIHTYFFKNIQDSYGGEILLRKNL